MIQVVAVDQVVADEPIGRTDGRPLTQDDPTVGSTDRLVGYFLVDCDDLDHAIEVSARIPIAEHGTVEIRPVCEQHAAMQGPAP